MGERLACPAAPVEEEHPPPRDTSALVWNVHSSEETQPAGSGLQRGRQAHGTGRGERPGEHAGGNGRDVCRLPGQSSRATAQNHRHKAEIRKPLRCRTF